MKIPGRLGAVDVSMATGPVESQFQDTGIPYTRLTLTNSSIAFEFGRNVLGPLSSKISAWRLLLSDTRTRSERTHPPSLGAPSTSVMRVPDRGGNRRQRWNAAERPEMPPPSTVIEPGAAMASARSLLSLSIHRAWNCRGAR